MTDSIDHTKDPEPRKDMGTNRLTDFGPYPHYILDGNNLYATLNGIKWTLVTNKIIDAHGHTVFMNTGPFSKSAVPDEKSIEVRDIVPGDVVTLKGGGFVMTVGRLYTESTTKADNPCAMCFWVDGVTVRQMGIPIAALTHSIEKEKE
jgi:uncharacterized protein YodC (DUF2158 family)